MRLTKTFRDGRRQHIVNSMNPEFYKSETVYLDEIDGLENELAFVKAQLAAANALCLEHNSAEIQELRTELTTAKAELARIVAEARLDEAKWWHGIAVTNNSLFVRDKSNAGVFSLGPDMTAAMKERLAAAEARVAEACLPARRAQKSEEGA